MPVLLFLPDMRYFNAYSNPTLFCKVTAPQRYNAHDRGVLVMLFGWWMRAKFGGSDHISLFCWENRRKKWHTIT